MIPRTFPSTFASNGQQQMVVYFLTSVAGLQRWTDYIPVKLTQGGSENTYDNNGYIDVTVVGRSATDIPFKDYVPVFLDDAATDAWQVNSTGFIPYNYAGFGDASLILDFTSTAALDSRITFTRASSATHFNSSGVLEIDATNVPRFEYGPATLAPLGLLIEEQRTNLLTYSEMYADVSWTKTRSSIVANTIIAPDGNLTGDKLLDDATAGSHTVRNATSVTITSGTTLTSSVFAKASESAFLIVGIGDGAGVNISRTTFNVSTGAIVSSTTAAANVSAPIPVITPAGNGWFRCSITATVTNVTTAQQWLFKGANSNGNASYTGDGTSGIFIWGSQLEAGNFITSYIPTVALQVTRAADVARMTGTNFSNWYNATEGTWYANFTPATADYLANKNIFLASDNTSANFNGLRYLSTGAAPGFGVTTASTAQASLTTGAMVENTAYKMAGAYKLNDFAVSRNGSTPSVDTSGTVPTVSRAEIGILAGTSTTIGTQYIRQLAYFPRRLSNEELQRITA